VPVAWVLFASLLPGLALSGPTEESVRNAARSVFADAALQRAWPDEGGVTEGRPGPRQGGRPGEGVEEAGEGARGRTRMERRPRPPEPTPAERGVATALLWLLLLVMGGFLLGWILLRVRPRPHDPALPPPAGGVAPSRGPAEPDPRSEAERLAAQGRWSEALHALLLGALAGVDPAGSLPPSLTSREVVRVAPLPDSAREDLGALVEAVERTHFGTRAATAADYEAAATRAARLPPRRAA
jgi:hypothetical protein